MSTVAVVKNDGCVAIAAETLTSFGSRRLTATHNAGATKILLIGDSYVGVVGSSVHQLHPRRKHDYYLNGHDAPNDPYESSQMSLLFANRFGIFGFYRLRDVFEYERFWANGSGEEYALGAMHAVYDSPLDAVQIAEAGVFAAIAFDEYSGGPIHSRVVELDRSASDRELERLLKV